MANCLKGACDYYRRYYVTAKFKGANTPNFVLPPDEWCTEPVLPNRVNIDELGMHGKGVRLNNLHICPKSTYGVK